MIDGRALSSEVNEIISTMTDALTVHVQLIDLDEKRSHARMFSSWASYELGPEGLEVAMRVRSQNDAELHVRINRRWIMLVGACPTPVADDGLMVTYGRPPPLSKEQVASVERAAERLRPLLPATSPLSEVPDPTGTSGSGSGGAEMGIPVWWARKVRN
jgi:hypothetical protein